MTATPTRTPASKRQCIRRTTVHSSPKHTKGIGKALSPPPPCCCGSSSCSSCNCKDSGLSLSFWWLRWWTMRMFTRMTTTAIRCQQNTHWIHSFLPMARVDGCSLSRLLYKSSQHQWLRQSSGRLDASDTRWISLVGTISNNNLKEWTGTRIVQQPVISFAKKIARSFAQP